MPRKMGPIRDQRSENEAEIFKSMLLLENPFNPDPDPTKPPKTFADFREIWDLINKKRELIIHNEYNQRFIIIGNYGCGKSHVLRYLYSELDTNFKEESFTGFSFYANIPLSRDFKDLYGELIESVGDQKFINVYKKTNTTIQNTFSTERSEIITAIKNLESEDPKKKDIAWKWLTAQNTISSERVDIGVTLQPHRDDGLCFRFLISIIELLIEKDVQIVFIGIDELERLGASTSSERRQTENMFEFFRNMIDYFPKRTFFCLSGTPEWEEIFSMHGAFRDRFSSDEVRYLKDFSEKIDEEFKLFILEYLDVSRHEILKTDINETLKKIKLETVDYLDREGFKKMGIENYYDEYFKEYEFQGKIFLFPFSKECLNVLKKVSSNIPRHILQNCNKLIQNKFFELSKIESEKRIDYSIINIEDLKKIIDNLDDYS